ncbi:hypothetical protein AB833_20520 [Chromatiales bacterium (ex Bugula neritina AB1)]|nr:hypothetical protein AB833_20520 [Chromatiales bacterium (ex Bugula neritina AB1)]
MWGIATDGLLLRVYRDNPAMTRPAWLEIDFQRLFDEDNLADFAAIWLLLHASRLKPRPHTEGSDPRPEHCILETWKDTGQQTGERALESLRDGVSEALRQLGTGFIQHPKSDALRNALSTGDIKPQDYYNQLLRLVYRLLFLLTAERRETALESGEEFEQARNFYTQGYSVNQLAERSGLRRYQDKHDDAWQQLKITFAGFATGQPQLAQPALGGIFKIDQCPHIDNASINNEHLFEALRHISWFQLDGVATPINYRDMGAEEFGSVYESLLEQVPQIRLEGKPGFSFVGDEDNSTTAGNTRKTTGSYYTPESLVRELIKSTLIPVMQQKLEDNPDDPVSALLSMKVVDPACGSGHFLLAAARTLSTRLAQLQCEGNTPSKEDNQQALRKVISACIYGVDINPMAVELCKVALWLESAVPGQPLDFLDHHIQCGNSLLGTTPKLLENGIPDDAFKPIEGDHKEVCKAFKATNKKERKEQEFGQTSLLHTPHKLANMSGQFEAITAESPDSFKGVEKKQRQFEKLVSDEGYQNAKLLADTWCAVFVWKKDESDLGRLCPTENDYRRFKNNPHSILPQVRSEVRRLADQYQFFHWHLAFPDVFLFPEEAGNAENKQTGWSRGFDVVLGNPPWERLKLAEQEWFAQKNPSIANAPNAAARKRLIAKLEQEDIALFHEFNDAQRSAEGEAHLLRSTGRFPLCGVGRDINSASVLTETMRMIVEANGKLGCVVPSAIATDNTTKLFFRDLMQSGTLDSLFDFENRNGIFPGVHRSYKFCLLTISGTNGTTNGGAELQFFALTPSDAGDPELTFRLNEADISLINPNTMTCPVFRTKRDAEVTKCVYRRLPVILREENQSNVWSIKTRPGLFHMSNHSHLFIDEASEGDDQKPLYEAKMIHQFDHRWADYKDGDAGDIAIKEKSHADYVVVPRYWVATNEVTSRLPEKPQWTLGVRDICRNTDERTTIASIMPATAIGGTLMLLESDANAPSLFGLNQATFNSFVFDYISRQKVAGTHLNPSIFKQLPVLSPADLAGGSAWNSSHSLADWLSTHILELTYTAWDLEAFALDCDYDGPPFRWDEERRFLLRCELDAAYFHLYLGAAEAWAADNPELREMFPTPRDAVDYIMGTFPIVRRKDIARTEVKNEAGDITTPGTYITRDTILQIYDAMTESIATGQPYKTLLDPPPGPIPVAQWDENNWPSHIHPSRD